MAQNLEVELAELKAKVLELDVQIESIKMASQNSSDNPLRKSSKEKAISELVESLEDFSGHGFRHCMGNKHIVFKLFWFVIIVGSIVGCGTFIVSSSGEFMRAEIITNIEIIRVEKILFPAITMCTYHGEYIIEDMIFNCEFNHVACDIRNVSTKVEIHDESPWSLYCIRINGGKEDTDRELLYSNRFGYKGGLQFTIIIPEDVELNYHISNNYQNLVYSDMNGVLHGGSYTYLTFHKTIQQSLGKPYGKCLPKDEYKNVESTYFRQTLETGYGYRQINCYLTCSKRMIQERCNCTTGQAYGHEDVSDSILKCLENEVENLSYRSFCLSQCPLECETVSFTYKKESWPLDENAVSSLYYNRTKDFLESTNSSYSIHSVGSLKRTILDVYFYYEDLSYTEITQIPKMSVTNLISDIGGTFGLFLGLSLLSLVEIAHIIVALVKVFLSLVRVENNGVNPYTLKSL